MSGLATGPRGSEAGWTTLQVAPFPATLRRRFKAACAIRGLRQWEGAIEAISAWVDREETP